MSFQGSELISIFTPSKGIFHTFTKTFRNKRYIVDHLSRLDLLLLWRWGKGLGEASGAAVSGAYHGGSGGNFRGLSWTIFWIFHERGISCNQIVVTWCYVDEAVQPILTRNHSFLPWLRHASAILTSLADPGWCTQRFHSFLGWNQGFGGELGMKIVGNIHVSLPVSSCRSKTQVHSLFQNVASLLLWLQHDMYWSMQSNQHNSTNAQSNWNHTQIQNNS